MSRKSGESMRKSWPICYHFCSDWEGLQMAEPGKVRTAFGVGFANGSRARSRACADYRRPRDHAPRFALSPRCRPARSEEHTSELQSLMRISYAVFCLKKKHTP